MQERPLNVLIDETVDGFVAEARGSFDEEEVVDRVLAHPEVRLLRKGYDAHDRSEGLEAVFLRDVRRLVTDRLRSDGYVAEGSDLAIRWHHPKDSA
jgi:hypothetical protein